jgi:hypothetical protein
VHALPDRRQRGAVMIFDCDEALARQKAVDFIGVKGFSRPSEGEEDHEQIAIVRLRLRALIAMATIFNGEWV